MSCGKACACPTYRDHVASIGFAPSAMPSRHHEAVEAKRIGKEWEKDLPAYKRLVDSGLNPKSTVGTARLESQAETAVEVETGVVMSPRQRRQYEAVRSDAGL